MCHLNAEAVLKSSHSLPSATLNGKTPTGQALFVEALTPNRIVFGGGPFGRWLSLDEVMSRSSHDGIGAPKRKDTREYSLKPSRAMGALSKQAASYKLEENYHQMPSLSSTSSWTP